MVADAFARIEAPVIDSDVIAREVVAPGSEALGEIAHVFGDEVLQPDGTLDRPRLRERVFQDDAARERLNAIVHPRVRSRIEQQLAALDAPYCIVVVPLLIEAGMTDLVDRILVVDCEPQQQRHRVLSREGMTPELAKAIIASQISRETRLHHADDVIDNRTSLAALHDQVAALDREYRDRARQLNG